MIIALHALSVDHQPLRCKDKSMSQNGESEVPFHGFKKKPKNNIITSQFLPMESRGYWRSIWSHDVTTRAHENNTGGGKRSKLFRTGLASEWQASTFALQLHFARNVMLVGLSLVTQPSIHPHTISSPQSPPSPCHLLIIWSAKWNDDPRDVITWTNNSPWGKCVVSRTAGSYIQSRLLSGVISPFPLQGTGEWGAGLSYYIIKPYW